jgi:outer membrane lipoprotein SlyB
LLCPAAMALALDGCRLSTYSGDSIAATLEKVVKEI